MRKQPMSLTKKSKKWLIKNSGCIECNRCNGKGYITGMNAGVYFNEECHVCNGSGVMKPTPGFTVDANLTAMTKAFAQVGFTAKEFAAATQRVANAFGKK